MSDLLIQYSTSTAFASGIIRRLTHSQFSHVDFILPDGLLGVSGPDQKIGDHGGVLIRTNPPWDYLNKPKVARLTLPDAIIEGVIDFAKGQVGKPFDNSALWGFLADQADEPPARSWRDPASWFCSELIVRSAEVGGVFPWPLAVTKNRISPGDSLLLFNPFMSPENISEFLQG